MLAAWLEKNVVHCAGQLELAGQSSFQFSEHVRAQFQKHPIQDWEADRWARGLKTRLLKLEGHFFRAGAGKKSLSLFVRNEEGLNVGLRREAITQAATYVMLVTDYGYPPAMTRFESKWMDVAVYGEDKDVLIYAETKAAGKILEKLCHRLESDFLYDVPRLRKDELLNVHDDAIMKAHHIWRHRPRYFWAICPTARKSYCVGYNARGFDLREIDLVPLRADTF